MKKSKILVPALAALAFSTAASITGTVAWFTANRLAVVTAGEFAVVNTSSALDVTLGNGVGTTTVDNGADHTVTVSGTNKLTDGSFDHTVTDRYIIKPDITGTKVGGKTTLAAATADASTLERDATNHVYTAFTWTMTFKVTFGNSASKDLGLFLDLSSAETYMHEKEHLAKDAVIPASTYYTDAACTAGNVVASGTVSAEEGVDYYRVSPSETGKAFRIAFVPTAIAGTGTNTSVAYSKVWAKNETAANCGFVDSTLAVDAALAKTSYSTASTKISGNGTSSTVSTETLGTSALMDSTAVAGIPADSSVSASSASSSNANFLGVFKLDAGKYVQITYTCVAWFDGTDVADDAGHMVSNATDFETIVTSMKFGVADLLAA